jgi:hypothetical protein
MDAVKAAKQSIQLLTSSLGQDIQSCGYLNNFHIYNNLKLGHDILQEFVGFNSFVTVSMP